VFGLPILALDVHGAKLFLPDDASVKIPVNSAEQTLADLSGAIDKLCREPDELIRMRGKGNRAANAYLWPQKIRVILNDYESITSLPTEETARGDL